MGDDSYQDDPTIPDQAQLWRRIPPWHFVRDENLGRLRPSSAAFCNHPDGSPMSILLAEDMAAAGRAPNEALRGHEGFALASITAGLARGCRQGVARDPLREEPAHGIVFGEKSKLARKKLAAGSQWVIPPPADL
ncbi:MAG TPA: hypothetical protein VEU62_06830 [Bryobacterales bacterium]|nr:hypothetical protein [Bryobacterales bacterium]